MKISPEYKTFVLCPFDQIEVAVGCLQSCWELGLLLVLGVCDSRTALRPQKARHRTHTMTHAVSLAGNGACPLSSTWATTVPYVAPMSLFQEARLTIPGGPRLSLSALYGTGDVHRAPSESLPEGGGGQFPPWRWAHPELCREVASSGDPKNEWWNS